MLKGSADDLSRLRSLNLHRLDLYHVYFNKLHPDIRDVDPHRLDR